MTTMWRSKSRQQQQEMKKRRRVAESQHLLSSSPEGCDEMLQVLAVYQMESPARLRLSALDRFLNRFRSGSVDADKPVGGLEEDGRTRAFSSQEASAKKDHSARPHPGDAVWVTSASHPRPLSPPPGNTQGPTPTGYRPPAAASTGFLSDLSLQNTSLTSGPRTGSAPLSQPDSAAHKMTLSGSTVPTAQELHDSVLSALNEGSGSPVKSPTEKKAGKKKPPGTFEYVVQDGDTIIKLGAQFDVTPSELIKINRLLSRTVFTGQTLFIPDPNYVPSNPSTPNFVPSNPPTPKSTSPIPDTRPKMDIPLATLPTVPGHAVPVTSPTAASKVTSPDTSKFPWPQHQKSLPEDENDKECMQKFLKTPVRRVMEEENEEVAGSEGSEGFTVKGTLLVTPNAIMFDPSVNDPIVIDKDDQLKFSVVVYMEEVKSVALFHDISPRMFWKQPKDLRSHSPKPEAYRSGQGKRPAVEGHADTQEGLELTPLPSRLTPDGASQGGDSNQHRASPVGRDAGGDLTGESVTGRMSEELERMAEMSLPPSDMNIQPGRASEEVEHALSLSQVGATSSPVIKQMSRSSEMEVCEIVQSQHSADVYGETRDFGGHMGRSSSEVHRQLSNALGRVYDASPGDFSGTPYFSERSDSTNENVSTPTQGFAPVHFTDRSPMTVTTHPKPVPGQRLLQLSQTSDSLINLRSGQNLIREDAETAGESNSAPGDQFEPCNISKEFSSLRLSSAPNDDEESADNQPRRSVTKADENKVQDGNGELVISQADKAASGDTESFAAVKDISRKVVDKLSFKIGERLSEDKREETEEEASRAKDGSPRLPFSPLRTPAQHLSSFFSYTSSFFRSTDKPDKDDSTSADGKGKYSSLPTSPPIKIQLRSEFTKEDISRALGPDPKDYLPQSDCHHFEESPLYLQIRRGLQKDQEVSQPRAFDHRNVSPLMDEYWFVVPRDMGDRMYNFLMEWQPDAYGAEEDTRPRNKCFYDLRQVEKDPQLVRAVSGKAAGDGPSGFLVSEEVGNESEKTWEILSKEEVYKAEEEQALHREDLPEECSIPELIGPTVIIKEEHARAIMRSLPRNMSVGYNWELVYATHKHGYSLNNLYMRTETVENDAPVILFIMDTFGSVFGAYLSNTIRPNDAFYGSGATFLFTFYPTFKKFGWQGTNQFFMHGTKDFFAVGAGEGLFGLWLDGDLNKGRSHRCTTFNNEVLAKEEDFSILQLEVWKFVDSSLL